jgi:predicted transcriptional regulator
MRTQIISGTLGEDHPSVKRVLEIAEDIMRKNKILNVENLYNLAKKQLKIPRNGLLSIIQFLINKKILIDGSKFSKESVLSNHIRNGIYNYIRLNPGVHFSMLRKKALPEEKGSSGQLVWHLEMLLKFSYIKKIKVGNYTVFLPFGLSEDVGRVLFLLRDRINYKLIKLLTEEKNVFKSEIYKEIDEKREDVYYRINNLINHDLVTFSETSDQYLCIKLNVKEIIAEAMQTIKIYIENNLSNNEEEV